MDSFKNNINGRPNDTVNAASQIPIKKIKNMYKHIVKILTKSKGHDIMHLQIKKGEIEL